MSAVVFSRPDWTVTKDEPLVCRGGAAGLIEFIPQRTAGIALFQPGHIAVQGLQPVQGAQFWPVRLLAGGGVLSGGVAVVAICQTGEDHAAKKGGIGRLNV